MCRLKCNDRWNSLCFENANPLTTVEWCQHRIIISLTNVRESGSQLFSAPSVFVNCPRLPHTMQTNGWMNKSKLNEQVMNCRAMIDDHDWRSPAKHLHSKNDINVDRQCRQSPLTLCTDCTNSVELRSIQDDFRAIFSLLLDLGSKKTLRSEKKSFLQNFCSFPLR